TAGVLEIARALAEVETDMTFIFIAFDSRESGMHGSYHYVDGAVARDDNIILMINMDRIAYQTYGHFAGILHGEDAAYSDLWIQLASEYSAIEGSGGSNSNGDHYPFEEAGYDAIWVREIELSPHLHEPSDSTVYMDFAYMTGMVRVTLATAYTVDQIPPRVVTTSLSQVGDGQSMYLAWEPVDLAKVEYVRISCYPEGAPWNEITVDIPAIETGGAVEGLTEGQSYAFFAEAVNFKGYSSLPCELQYGAPSSVPVSPRNPTALPLLHSIRITWGRDNTELDFDHYAVIRDGEVITQTLDNEYIDDDPALGTDVHSYYVAAVDTDGTNSDTVGVEPLWMRVATLDPERFQAVNRTGNYIIDFVSAKETGLFLQEAFEGYDYDYYCDTLATKYPDQLPQLDLLDMVGYGAMVVGAEAGKWDDIGDCPQLKKGILDTLAYYLSIGGKAIIFGRWGNITEGTTVDYTVNSWDYDDAYNSYFHIARRVLTPTSWPFLSTVVTCDLVGAHSVDADYPDLVWDSATTLTHATSQAGLVTDVGGIPCVSYAELVPDQAEVIYTYDSRNDDPNSEGKPVAWRYLGTDYQYVYFDIPLSFFEREAAKAALRQAVHDLLGIITDADDQIAGSTLPRAVTLSQNYPNPFNPTTEMVYSLPKKSHVILSIYNILGQRVTTLVDSDQPAGTHRVGWNSTDDNGSQVASGIYLYRLQTGERVLSKKMLLLK
ncbi:MAG: M28 family peptidase, partial [Candidatus Zixiibacteriota bacterium]